MRIEYVCKFCKHLVGELNQPGWTTDDADRYCGFTQLTQSERAEAIAWHDADRMQVQTVCDHCQRAVEHHPELLIEGKLLQ